MWLFEFILYNSFRNKSIYLNKSQRKHIAMNFIRIFCRKASVFSDTQNDMALLCYVTAYDAIRFLGRNVDEYPLLLNNKHDGKKGIILLLVICISCMSCCCKTKPPLPPGLVTKLLPLVWLPTTQPYQNDTSLHIRHCYYIPFLCRFKVSF